MWRPRPLKSLLLLHIHVIEPVPPRVDRTDSLHAPAVPTTLLSPIRHVCAQPQSPLALPDRNQEKGPKLDTFFSAAMRSTTGISRAAARTRDQKR